MNKKTKTCLFVLLLFFIVSTCSSISLIFGIYIEKNQSQENNKATVEIEEQPVYYNQTSPIRYIDEDINPDTFNTLLNSSEIHFKFEYDTDQDEDKYTKYINFILVNLENQYSRLSVKFDTTISEKISVILTDDLDMFQEDLNLIIDNSGIVPYSAFALGNELIEIYINPLYTADKFDIAQTCSHELVHIFQYQINNSIALNDPNWASAHWFIEGMAEGFSYPQEDPLVHNYIYTQVPDTSTLNTLIESSYSDDYLIAYDISKLFFMYLSNLYGEDTMIQLLKSNINFDLYFSQVIGISPDTAYNNWIATL